jgi:hypothetical protein
MIKIVLSFVMPDSPRKKSLWLGALWSFYHTFVFHASMNVLAGANGLEVGNLRFK